MSAENADFEHIAIIGLAGRFPGADTPEELWHLVSLAQSGIQSFTREELTAEGLECQLVDDADYVRRRGVVAGAELFDAEFFGYSPREAEHMDPQQRVFLGTSDEKVDRFGCGGDRQDRVNVIYNICDAGGARWQEVQSAEGTMDERMTRLWAGSEAEAIGYGGLAAVSRATGLASSTIQKGRRELREGATAVDLVNVRRKGSGRRTHQEVHADLLPALKQLVDPATRGDPESPLRWTAKSAVVLARQMLDTYDIQVSDKTIAKLLRQMGYSMQAPKKNVEGAQHPDRNAQFEHINARAIRCMERDVPVISVDTKKKELVGNFKNAGVEWQPKDQPELVDVHDFPSSAVGKAIPYGIYDVANNVGFVNVGTDHDTPVFAVTSIRTWWQRMGSRRYPDATELFLCADAGGSNSYRSRVWKVELQRFADRTGLTIHVSHFPPGTSKWNKVEHRLFSFITMNWRGRPLRTYETVVNLIGNTTNSEGLVVQAKLDKRCYPTGKKVTQLQMRELNIEYHRFHGDWNYTLKPRL